MKVKVIRYNSKEDFTDSIMYIDGIAQCFGIEDEYRAKKVWGETRIADGIYELKLKTHGGFHNRYSKKFPDFHIGMLEIMDVPNFGDVLIHIGNYDKDTAACYLVGMNQNLDKKGFLGESTTAYKKVYPQLANAVKSGEKTIIEFITIEKLTDF